MSIFVSKDFLCSFKKVIIAVKKRNIKQGNEVFCCVLPMRRHSTEETLEEIFSYSQFAWQ